MGKSILINASLLVVLLSPAQGSAQKAEDAQIDESATVGPTEVKSVTPRSEGSLGINAALKVGGTFHGLFNKLGPFVLLELEGGISLLAKRLDVDLSVAWAQPAASNEGTDPRLTTADYETDIDQDFFTIGLLGRYRFFEASSTLNLNLSLGPRLFLLRSVTNGSAGDAGFGENRQYETRFGGFAALGGEFRLGPGAILLEVGMQFADLDGFITGDTNSSSLDALLGYRFMF